MPLYPPCEWTFRLFRSLQDLLVVCARGGDDYLFRRNDQSALCRDSPVEHLFDHRFESVNNGAAGHILGGAFDLVAFQILRVVHRNSDLAIVRLDIVQSGFQKYISDNQFAVLGNILKCNRNNIRLSICTSRQIPHARL